MAPPTMMRWATTAQDPEDVAVEDLLGTDRSPVTEVPKHQIFMVLIGADQSGAIRNESFGDTMM